MAIEMKRTSATNFGVLMNRVCVWMVCDDWYVWCVWLVFVDCILPRGMGFLHVCVIACIGVWWLIGRSLAYFILGFLHVCVIGCIGVWWFNGRMLVLFVFSWKMLIRESTFGDPGFLLLISEFWNCWLSCAHHGFIWLGPGFVLSLCHEMLQTTVIHCRLKAKICRLRRCLLMALHTAAFHSCLIVIQSTVLCNMSSKIFIKIFQNPTVCVVWNA